MEKYFKGLKKIWRSHLQLKMNFKLQILPMCPQKKKKFFCEKGNLSQFCYYCEFAVVKPKMLVVSVTALVAICSPDVGS